MTKRLPVFCAVLVVSISGFAAAAQDLPASKQTVSGLYVSAAEAAEMLSDRDAVLVDVRTRSEVAFVGLPTRVDVHIPYMQMPMVPEYDASRRTYRLELNPDFPLVFRSWAEANGIGPDRRIVIMCRSGSRSARAADLLAQMGYTQVYSMVDGFEGDRASEGPNAGHRVINGWRNAGLEWSYSVESEQVYPADF